MKRICTIAVMLLASVGVGCQQAKKSKPVSVEDAYINRQEAIIERHKAMLVKAGRITDPDHFDASLYLATYGWHSGCDTSKSLSGNNGENARWLAISTGCDGSFGAYSFSQEAFKQAQRLYVIHGEMLAGTDILIDASWGECVEEKGGGCILGSSSGYASPRKPGAFDAAVVGYSVGSLTYCMKYGAHYEHCDGLFDSKDMTEPSKVVKFIDGGHVQLDHKAKYDAEMYGLVITPPDYVDMCDCTVPTAPPEDKPVKACVQGGSLAPGESCSISVPLVQ